MPLEHEEAQPQKDSASTGYQVASNEGGDTGQGLPPAITPPQTPEPPAPQEPAPKKPYKWRRDLKLGIEFLGLAALIVYTVFSILQWLQIRYTNQLTARALDGNKETLDRTLGKMQAQIDTANAQYGEAQIQTGQTTIIAKNSGAQAVASSSTAQSAQTQARSAFVAVGASQGGEPKLDLQSLAIYRGHDRPFVDVHLKNVGDGYAFSTALVARIDVRPPSGSDKIFPLNSRKIISAALAPEKKLAAFPSRRADMRRSMTEKERIDLISHDDAKIYVWGQYTFEGVLGSFGPYPFCRSTKAENVLRKKQEPAGEPTGHGPEYEYDGPTEDCSGLVAK